MNAFTDRIEKQILLKAPRSRVWRALSNGEEFGNWFGVNFRGKQFVAGESVQGHITYPGYEYLVMDVLVERIEPEHHLSWRWHPAAVDITVDYSPEPTNAGRVRTHRSRLGHLAARGRIRLRSDSRRAPGRGVPHE